MRSARRRLWPAFLPLTLILAVFAATCGSPGAAGFGVGRAVAARANDRDSVRGARPMAKVATNEFRRRLTVQAFDSGRPTFNVTPTFDGLGMLGVSRSGVLFAVQRRGASSIDPTGQIAIFEFRGAATGWVARPVYDSEWDDRNAAGGVTPTGAVVVFFARYDARTGRWLDLGYIRSVDDGQTFSIYRTLPVGPDRWFSPYGPMIVLPSGRLMQLFYGNNGYTYRLRAMFSDDDGQTWGDDRVVDAQSFERPTEAAGVLVGGATDSTAQIVVVSRTEPGPSPKARGGLYQYASPDGGRTWRRMGFLNVGDTPSDISPWMSRLGDGKIALVWAARRTMTIEVSLADGDRVMQNRRVWKRPYTLFTSRLAEQRPRQAANFGYPAIAHIGPADEDAVCVFFDANTAD
ncbi:MAG: sialidase family protein, partial [Actinomycetota bacterium]